MCRARARAHRQPCRKLHAVFAATNDKHASGGRVRTEPALAAVPVPEQRDCPAAGDPEEKIGPPTVQYYYTNNATCSFGASAPAERRLLFGVRPQAGVCVPT